MTALTLALPDTVRAFLTGAARFATIATINPDGAPHQTVIWFALDGEEIVVNAAEGRRWSENLRRDPRASLMVEAGYEWVSLRGEVVVVDDQEQAQGDIAAMARRYHADVPDHAEELIVARFQRQERVSFRLRPAAVNYTLEGAP